MPPPKRSEGKSTRQSDESVDVSSQSSQTEYPVKELIGEKKDYYRVDWADDLINRKKFRPTWVIHVFLHNAILEVELYLMHSIVMRLMMITGTEEFCKRCGY